MSKEFIPYHQYKLNNESVTEEVFYKQFTEIETVEVFIDDLCRYVKVAVKDIKEVMDNIDVTCHPMKYDLSISKKDVWTLDMECWDCFGR